MYIPFTQGIITHAVSGNQQAFLTYSGGYVTIHADNGHTDVAVAHGSANYLLTESVTIANAWGPIPTNVDCWLYWDVNKRTAARTFGITTVEPVYGSIHPPALQDQHWFNTSTRTMFAYVSGAYREVIRVFAAKVNNGTFTSVGIGIGSHTYAGTQVGMSTTSSRVGRIFVDDTSAPLRKTSGQFVTTEQDLFVTGSPTSLVRLEADVIAGTAQYENLHAYQVVKFADFGMIIHATYDDIQNTTLLMILEDVTRYDTGILCAQGQVTNPSWNWTTVGAPLWIDDTGALTEANAHAASPLTHPVNKDPIARVLTQTSILFAPRLC